MASSQIAYGRALYYPHINFQKKAWANAAALYYEGLDRIVPENYGPTDDVEIIRRLNDEEEFTREINPKRAADRIARDFLNYARTHLANRQNREILFNQLAPAFRNRMPLTIHVEKMAYMLQQELPKMGLARSEQGPTNGNWFEFDPITGALYMTFLANHIAGITHMPVVTDNAAFQPLINGMQTERFSIAGRDIGYNLASMVINTVVPENIAKIPPKKIITFRNKYSDERHLFYREINNLTNDLGHVTDEDTLKQMLEFRKKSILLATKDIDRAFKGMRISTTNAMLGLTAPAVAEAFGPVVATAGLITVAMNTVLEHANGYRRTRRNSPYGYVLSLRKNLKSETFANQLVKGKLIF